MQLLEPESHSKRRGRTAELLPEKSSTLRGRLLIGSPDVLLQAEALILPSCRATRGGAVVSAMPVAGLWRAVVPFPGLRV